MARRYLLFKYGGDGRREPIDSFTASGMDEATDALKWLKTHHPERVDLRLGPGEFFEILDEDHCPPEEWRQAEAELKSRQATRREAQAH